MKSSKNVEANNGTDLTVDVMTQPVEVAWSKELIKLLSIDKRSSDWIAA
jgi:hypothetical protein